MPHSAATLGVQGVERVRKSELWGVGGGSQERSGTARKRTCYKASPLAKERGTRWNWPAEPAVKGPTQNWTCHSVACWLDFYVYIHHIS